MFKKFIFSSCGIFLLAGCNANTATRDFNVSRVYPAGKTSQLSFFHHVKSDCSSGGYATVRVITAPANGTLTTQNGTGPISLPASSSSANCNGKQTNGVRVLYTPRSGYSGPEQITVESIFPNGRANVVSYNINVR